MLAKLYSGAVCGLEGNLVEIEADVSQGVIQTVIVGLPDVSVQESKERVRSALKNSGYFQPRNRITINLAPADLKKEGPGFDLPIALVMLIASGQMEKSKELERTIIIGELGLGGRLRKTKGILPMVLFARERGFPSILIPRANEMEASLVDGIEILCAENIHEVVDHFNKIRFIKSVDRKKYRDVFTKESPQNFIDIKNIYGQEKAKRALIIAASGMHNILFVGPPGSGKSMLAKAFAGILPRPAHEEILETTKIHSVAGVLPEGKIALSRPFRSPHHSASAVAIVGGGANPKPGEISLAHRGVLFMDEFPEFSRDVIENLRQPLEEGKIVVGRAQGSFEYPAKFILIASQNPCPCGFYQDPKKECTCTQYQITKYQKKISGPILDRIDLHLDMPRISFKKIEEGERGNSGLTSRECRNKVHEIVEIQKKRFLDARINYNSEMTNEDIKKYCRISQKAKELLKRGVDVYQLSMRGYFKIIKLSQTIADLSSDDFIKAKHVAEAMQYRESSYLMKV